MKRDIDRLEHLLDAIERIEKYSIRGKQAFLDDELVQNWIVSHLQIIGEASRALSPAFRKKHSVIPWKKIVGMRNIIVHDYFEIDANIVWAVVDGELPKLKRGVKGILDSLGGKS